MHTHTDNPNRRFAFHLIGVALTLGLLTAACGSDGVESSVSDAAQAAEKAADDPTAANAEAAEAAFDKAAKTIKDRYNAIVNEYNQAESKINDGDRQAYTGFRNDLAAVEADVVRASESTGSSRTDAWNSAKDKVKDLTDAVGKHESGDDKATNEAFDKLVDNLGDLEEEIARGLGVS